MKLFLCVPFSSKVDANGDVDAEYRQAVERLLTGLRERGHDVYCALEFASWKLGGLTPPEDELAQDLKEIDLADKVVALLEERVSAGVQLENGYAFAKGKTVEIYQIGNPAWSNVAFAKLNGHEIFPVETFEDFVERVLGGNHLNIASTIVS